MTQRVYADSSALVKLVLSEPESAALSRFLKGRARTLTSRLASVEVSRAVARSAGKSPQHALVMASLWDNVDIAELDSRVSAAAAALEPVGLRSLDAIHLASALAVREEIDAFITYDVRLADAARAHGLRVVAPA